jgi:predicted PurR-regulated permease PerM
MTERRIQTEGFTPAALLGLLAALALAVGCLLVLWPFLSSLLWAAILVYSTWPAYRMLRERTGLSPGWAAGIMVLVEFLLIGLPLVFATPTRREDIEGLRHAVETFLTQGMPGLGTWLGNLPLIGGFLGEQVEGVDFGLSGIADMLGPYAGTLAQNALSVLLAVLSGIAELLVAIFLAFFLYRDGPSIARRGEAALERLAGDRTRHLVALTGDVTRGVVYGLLGTALVQGLMTAFGLWIAGVPRPVLLGVVAGVISIMPVGAPLVWIPATLWLISRGADLPLLLTLLGALGGVFAFGFLGLFLGPVLLAVGFTLLKDWATEGAEGGGRTG